MTSRSQRRAPDAEWVLMYRKGLTRARIAELEKVPISTVAYHLAVARAQDAGLQEAHEVAAGGAPAARVTVQTMQRMNDLIAMVRTEGRYPSSKADAAAERSLAVWLQRRRRDAAEGRLAPEVRDGLACLPGWPGIPRTVADEERWQRVLCDLAEYLAAGQDWPRHKNTDTETEHHLGVWLHAHRYKLRRGELDPAKEKALDAAVPGWSAGRPRGRKARPAPDRQGEPGLD
ncbi:helicase associated domain-containing protein [Arthrobacter sp. SPG23]|uniref:helicase associated domain-containing protein n=1 Tax=Arthrobacter sp. SPG23 TaxID=1610703 RepID=UPI001F3E7128|nr:helicase associated domain-containing protein [Arthrobacter sp. SPG23]